MELSNAELIELLTTPFYRGAVSPADTADDLDESVNKNLILFAISQTYGSIEL